MANIKRNLVYNFLLSCSQVLIPLLSIPYISRVLDPEGIGRVSFIDSFTFYIVILAESGITVYGIREIAKVKNDPVKLKAVVSELMTLHIVSSSIAIILYITGIFFLWDKIRDIRLILFSCSFLAANFFSVEWYFWGRERFGFIALRTIIIRLSGLASIFLLIKKPDDFVIYYAIIVISAVVTIIWNLSILFRDVPVSFRGKNWKRHLKYVWVTYLINIIYCIPLLLDNVLLRLVGTASAVGVYSFSVKIVRISTNLIADSFLVFFPRIVTLNSESEQQQSQQKILQNAQFIILLAVPMGIGIFLIAGELSAVFFGDKFIGVENDLRVLSLFPFVKAASLFFSNPILIAHHFEKNFLKNLVVSSLFFIVSALFLGTIYSHLGVCIALVVTEVILLFFNFFSIKKNLKSFKILEVKTFAHSLAASLAFIPVVFFFQQSIDPGWLRLALMLASCSIVYVLVLVFVFKNNFSILVKNSAVNSVKGIFGYSNIKHGGL